MARCASIGSPVTSPIAQTLRIEVAQWSSMRMNGPSMVEVEPLEARSRRCAARRPTATRMLVGRDAARSAPSAPRPAAPSPSRRPGRAPRRRSAPRRRARCRRRARPGASARHRRPAGCGPAASTTVTFGAELGEGGAELEPDIAGADDRQALAARSAATAPRSRRSPGRRRAARAAPPAPSRSRARRARRGWSAAPVSVSTRQVLPSSISPRPCTILTLCLLQQRGDAAGQAADDAVLPGDGCARSRCVGALDPQAEGRGLRLLGGACSKSVGRMDQRLRRDAADIEAGAAEAAPARPARCRGRAGRRGSRRHSRRARRRGPAALAVDLVHLTPP